MPDVHCRIREQPLNVLEAICDSMLIRAGEPEMQAICARYMQAIDPELAGRNVLEVGCGNGASSGLLVRHLGPENFLGVDPCAFFVDRARQSFGDDAHVRFDVAEAAATGQPDGVFDVVVAHTVYSHLVDPGAGLAEAWRVLKPGGQLVIFDGDYATITFALFENDPLEAVVSMIHRHLVHAPFIMRHLPLMAREAGFAQIDVSPHAYVQTTQPHYLRTLIDRAFHAASVAGEISDGLVSGLRSEVDQRIADGRFYGAIVFVSMTATKAP